MAGEVLGLRKKHHPPWCGQGDDNAVDEREMIAGQQEWPGARDVLRAFYVWAIDQPGNRAQCFSGQRVEHGSQVISRFGCGPANGLVPMILPAFGDPVSGQSSAVISQDRSGGFEGWLLIWQTNARPLLSAPPLSARGAPTRAPGAVSPRGCRADSTQ